MKVREYVKHLESKNQLSFTTQQALEAVGGSVDSIRTEIRALKQAQEIATPVRSFHVIVPPEYRVLSCIPPKKFIDNLMDYLNEPYYIGLLKAAELFGAAHQKPQVFQVMVRNNRPNIKCGKVRIEFIARGNLEKMPVKVFQTPFGRLRFSTPEVTAFELLGYPLRAAGIHNVATVLIELAESLNPKKLVSAAKLQPISWVQRLGYMIERFCEEKFLAESLKPYILEHAHCYAPLQHCTSVKNAEREPKWKILVNTEVYPDL